MDKENLTHWITEYIYILYLRERVWPKDVPWIWRITFTRLNVHKYEKSIVFLQNDELNPQWILNVRKTPYKMKTSLYLHRAYSAQCSQTHRPRREWKRGTDIDRESYTNKQVTEIFTTM